MIHIARAVREVVAVSTEIEDFFSLTIIRTFRFIMRIEHIMEIIEQANGNTLNNPKNR